MSLHTVFKSQDQFNSHKFQGTQLVFNVSGSKLREVCGKFKSSKRKIYVKLATH